MAIMYRYAYLALFLAACGSSEALFGRSKEFSHSNVVQLGSKNFDNKVGDGQVYFIKFFAPWCGHCKKLASIWGQLGDEFAGENGVQIAQVDCTKARDVCDKSNIGGFPTLKVFFNGAVESTFRGKRDLPSLKDFLEETVTKLTAETTA